MGTIYFDLLIRTFPINKLIWRTRYDCYLNLSRGLEPSLVSNNIALRELLNVDSLALELAKWNREPWDVGFPNFTARPTTPAATAALEKGGVRVVPCECKSLFVCRGTLLSRFKQHRIGGQTRMVGCMTRIFRTGRPTTRLGTSASALTDRRIMRNLSLPIIGVST